MSKIKVNQIEAATGSTITIPSGQTLDISSTTLTLPSTVVTTTGTQTLTNKTIGVSQLTGTLPVANGGTGLTTLGTAGQALKVNSGATGLEFGTLASPIAQMVINSSTTITTNTSLTTFVQGTPSITITPTSASNKIYVEWHLHTRGNPTTATDIGFQFEIYRGATLVSTSSDGRYYMYGHTSDINSRAITQLAYYDTTHNTTSAITYTFKFRNPHSSREIAVGNTGSGFSEISWVKAFELI